ncbi:MAG: MBOAT family O-acyltransferase [Ferruginibacter sp.]
MLFNSLHFLCFFIAVTTAYFAVPHKWRWQLLLGASCYFYMAFVPVYLLILAFTIITDYFAGIYIERATGRKRKFFLLISLAANISVLAVFKYYNFLTGNIAAVLSSIGYQSTIHKLSILLPIGLSFHTFQAMSYSIEVYRGKQKAEKHFGIFSLYIMFYPQLVAGPIERPQNLLHQFYEKHTFDYTCVTGGLKLMAWGFFKKLVIADRLAAAVDMVYNQPHAYQGSLLILATVCFAFQVYCDFSGYSDIAVGAARVMGFNLTKNFNSPYSALSVTEFWRRWHISLSTWFRDYVYIPLGGSKVGNAKICFNILLTFLLSGLWHGANWTFIVWGLFNGLLVIGEKGFFKTGLKEKLPGTIKTNLLFDLFRWLITFSLICIGWIFFRAKDLNEALYIMQHLFTRATNDTGTVISSQNILSWYNAVVATVALVVLFMVERKQRATPVTIWLMAKPPMVRWGIYWGLLMSIILLGVFQHNRQFIYFQF